jgi:topoisomerase-4 subunit A
VLSAVYFDGTSKTHYVKRFQIETTTINKKFNFISDHKQSYLKLITTEKQPQLALKFLKGKVEEEMDYDFDMLIDVKGWRAVGNKLSTYPIIEVNLIASSKPENVKDENQDSEEIADDASEELDVGTTISLSSKKDEKEQLGLF